MIDFMHDENNMFGFGLSDYEFIIDNSIIYDDNDNFEYTELDDTLYLIDFLDESTNKYFTEQLTTWQLEMYLKDTYDIRVIKIYN